MGKLWNETSIGDIMRDEKMSKEVLEVIKDDAFLYGYFTSFGKKAKHTFSEVEEGSQMAGAIDKKTLEKIKNVLGDLENAKI